MSIHINEQLWKRKKSGKIISYVFLARNGKDMIKNFQKAENHNAPVAQLDRAADF